MPITINKVTNTTSGFCHEYTVIIKRDGSVISSSLSFGNYGDKNITKITFDLSDLTYQGQYDLTNYTHALIVKFPDIVDEDNGLDYKAYELPYEDSNSTSTFEVPEELTNSFSSSYQLIYALLEQTDSSAGNIADQQEIFISKTFTANVFPTNYSDELDFTKAITYSDSELALVKPKIILSPESSHLTISSSGTDFGEKRDSFIKRIVLNESSEDKLDEGLTNRFLIINNYIIKMSFSTSRKNICSCFIPRDITTVAGTYSYFIVATNDDENKRWVSNTLSLSVNDNFLDNVKDITITGDSGYISTSDNIFILSSDNWAIDTQ